MGEEYRCNICCVIASYCSIDRCTHGECLPWPLVWPLLVIDIIVSFSSSFNCVCTRQDLSRPCQSSNTNQIPKSTTSNNNMIKPKVLAKRSKQRMNMFTLVTNPASNQLLRITEIRPSTWVKTSKKSKTRATISMINKRCSWSLRNSSDVR